MLNIINKSPLDRGSRDSCLQSAEGGAALQPVRGDGEADTLTILNPALQQLGQVGN